jgi:outer membrane immunogenic protein
MVMKRYSVKRLFSLCGFLMAAAISPAQAADTGPAAGLGYAAVEMPGTWTGFNIGTGISAGAVATQVRGGPSGTGFTMLEGEGLGGSAFMPWVTAGYNFQLGPVVAGIAANLTYDEGRETHTDRALGQMNIYAQGFGSLQLRGGYVFDNLLVYATGGFELARIKASGNTLRVEDKKLDFAPVAGIGVEYAVDRSRTLLIRAEVKVFWISENLDFAAGARDAREGIATISLGFIRKY